MREKIDIVYTWVDGNDPVWRKKRQGAMEKLGNINLEQHGNIEGRFRDNRELKYSLRSLEKYFPEHGKIFIVTDNRVPDFLKLDNRIKIIDHRDFMDPGSIPTFSLKNIISQIPKIPQISKKLLLFNDDIFLGPDFVISDFFGEVNKFYFIPFNKSQLTPQIVSGISGEDILIKKYSNYIPIHFYVTHTPKGVIKKDFLEMSGEIPDILQSVSLEIFRDIKKPGIVGDLYSRWMILKKTMSFMNEKRLLYLVN